MSMFSELLHKVTGTPTAEDQKRAAAEFDRQVTAQIASNVSTVLQQPSNVGAAPAMTNEHMLLFGGIGLVAVLAILKKKQPPSPVKEK